MCTNQKKSCTWFHFERHADTVEKTSLGFTRLWAAGSQSRKACDPRQGEYAWFYWNAAVPGLVGFWKEKQTCRLSELPSIDWVVELENVSQIV